MLRGNRFLHLQGDHDKGNAVPHLLDLTTADTGRVVTCGDAPNDLALLRHAALRIIVPGPSGPDRTLVEAFPDAVVAPEPGGRGGAAAVLEMHYRRLP